MPFERTKIIVRIEKGQKKHPPRSAEDDTNGNCRYWLL